ncbi:NADH-quinone oxidoreductase subunit E [Cognatishimia sp. F0-27]|uniref:NADH-quinone oxidoreductase subunit E n=1 Tax=Cognatishimia sp. F0-27 TaxID=2816855 RepID=UPI001D0C09C8|nr:NADH-quinone oxidoreductase subunit E [Cognatishimia sp. F0-27]MCC1492304.1 NADH-quinone oxidoreductase subunit E [Cognatishimia sp. F0-27]
MLRRLHPEQPDSFAFTADNQTWAEAQIRKYPEGRQASAIIPLLWRAQEQEGWLSRPAIEHVAEMLDMAYMRALEVATFYFMFQLQPVGSVAHIQICGTTSCMICGAEDLVAVCQDKIAKAPHALSADGKFSWEEVECLGACANAPMAQIGKDYYEDLTAEKLGALIDALAKGEVPQVGPQNGRFAAEPASGLSSLTEFRNAGITLNASAQLAHDIGDTVKRIDGSEVPFRAPWTDPATGEPAEAANSGRAPSSAARDDMMPPAGPDGAQGGRTKGEEPAPRNVGAASDGRAEAPGEAPEAEPKAKPATDATDAAPETGRKPETLDAPKGGKADDLKKISGVGPKMEALLHSLGFYHFEQIAAWGPEEVAWVDDHLEGFKGRVSRDNWVEQAKSLMS